MVLDRSPMERRPHITSRLSTARELGVEWAQSLAPAAPQPHLRAECAEPGVVVPGEVLDYAQAVAREPATYHYSDFRGTAELRQAVARRLARVHGAAYDPETEILITTGCTEANLLAVSAAEPGDELLMLDPSHANFATYAELAGARPVYVPTVYDSGWEVYAAAPGHMARSGAARLRPLKHAGQVGATAAIPGKGRQGHKRYGVAPTRRGALGHPQRRRQAIASLSRR